MKTTKDVARGTANCRVYDPADDSHVSRSSPISLKRKALEEDPQYQDGAINRIRPAPAANEQIKKPNRFKFFRAPLFWATQFQHISH